MRRILPQLSRLALLALVATSVSTWAQAEAAPSAAETASDGKDGPQPAYPSVAEQIAQMKAENAATTTSSSSTDTPNTNATAPPPTELPPPDSVLPESGFGDIIGPFFKSMFMLIVVLAIAYLSLHKGLGKLMQRTQDGKRMKIVERVSLDQRRTLFLVNIDGREMLIGGGEGGVQMLKDLSEPTTPPTFSLDDTAPDGAGKLPPVSQPLRVSHAPSNDSNDSNDDAASDDDVDAANAGKEASA